MPLNLSVFLVSRHLTVPGFRRSSFETCKCLDGPAAIRARPCALPVISICVNVCSCISEHTSARRRDTWEEKGNDKKCLTCQSSTSLRCSAEEEEEEGCNPSILLMRKASVWELRVLKEWNSDLRRETKKEKQPVSVFKVSQAAFVASQPRLYRN